MPKRDMPCLKEDYSVFSGVKVITPMEAEGRRQSQGLDAIHYKLDRCHNGGKYLL